VIAHVAGAPVEEVVLPFLTWSGAGLLLAYTGVMSRFRRLRSARPDEAPRSQGPA
jgi:hypothetical protein